MYDMRIDSFTITRHKDNGEYQKLFLTTSRVSSCLLLLLKQSTHVRLRDFKIALSLEKARELLYVKILSDSEENFLVICFEK